MSTDPSAISGDWFRAMVETAPDGMLLVDETGRILLVNHRTEVLFGHRRDDLLGQPVEILLPASRRAAHEAHRARFFASPSTREMGQGLDLVGRRKDGSEFPVEISLSPLATASGLKITAAVRDVTARMEAQRTLARQTLELQRSNAALESFAATASHDLQAPLRHVAGLTAIVAEMVGERQDARFDRHTKLIRGAVERMQLLIRNLLALSRLSRTDTEIGPVELDAVIAAALEFLTTDIADSRSTVNCLPLPRVLGNEPMLVQLLQNLIGNAIKFRSPDRRTAIEVAASTNGTMCEVEVRDNGIGFAMEDAERIFEPFERLHAHSEFPGSGIGLAICRRIVADHHGGQIRVSSEPGKGSVFTFTLPLA